MTDLKKITEDIQTKIESLKENQETSFSEIQATINIILAKVNTEEYKEDSVLQDNKIKKSLPLNSIENFLEFENILKSDQEAFMQMVNESVY